MAVKTCAIVAMTLKLAAAAMEPFIVGGNFTKIQPFAHAALVAIDSPEGYFTCGGSILNHLILLSAAHCVEDCDDSSKVYVHVGHEEMNKGQTVRVERFVMHYDYDSVTVKNDIALLRVRKALQLGQFVRRVSLMEKPPYRDSAATVAGWGLIDEINRVSTQKLKYVTQKVWSRASCHSVLPSTPEGTFCAGLQNDANYASEGDSGSALIVRNYIQIGLVSYKDPRVSRSVVVYTDVGHFYSWIQRRAKSLFCLEENKIMNVTVTSNNSNSVDNYDGNDKLYTE